MRVHLVVNSYSLLAGGGAELLIRRLHESLLARGIDSNLFGIAGGKDDKLPQTKTLGLSSPYSWKGYMGLRDYLARECGRGDLVHVNLFPAVLYCGLCRHLIQGPVMFSEHNTHNRRRGSLRGKFIDRITYRDVSHVACVSQGVEEALLGWRPDLKGRTSVVFNGIHLPFTERQDRQASKRPLIVSTGNLNEQKNYERCLEAIALLKDLEFDYWIAGKGKYRLRLEALIGHLNLTDRTKLLGHVDDIPALLQRASIFLNGSLWEGFGLAVVEAMNASLPVVASNVAGLREIVGSDSDGTVLVDPRSPVSIADGLRTLLQNPLLCNRLGNQGFLRSQRFNIEQCVDNYLSLYHRLLGR